MKKFLLSLAALACTSIGALADTAEISFPDVYSDITGSSLKTLNGLTDAVPNSPITISYSKGTVKEEPTYYANGAALRFYNGNKLTFSIEAGYAISKIEFTATEDKYAVKGSADEGTFTQSGTTSTWAATEGQNTTSIVFTPSSKAICSKMVFTYEATAPKDVEDVEFSYELDSNNDATVTLSCATEDATIYYGFSEDEITNVYSEPFKVAESCTIYAFAQKDEATSLTKSLQIALYKSLRDLVTKATTSEAITINGNFSVLYQYGSYLIVTDGVSNMVLYGSTVSYDEGTAISKIEGTVSPYHSLFELKDFTLTEGGEGATYEVQELTSIAALNYDDHIFDEYTLKSATISGKRGSGKNAEATISLGDETIALLNTFNTTFQNGANFDITGFVWRYDSNLQFIPVSVSEGEALETVEQPEITPTKHDLHAGDEITIKCATEGATIYYTVDDSVPTKESTLYEGSFPFPDDAIDFTVKAIAVYEGEDKAMLDSPIASRSYHVFDPYCNIITVEGHHEEAGMNYKNYKEHSCIIDDVKYTMFAAHNNERGLQMKNVSNRFCYVIQSGDNEGLAIDGIEIDFNLDGTSNNEPKFFVRASNTPFVAGDKESITSDGVYIGEINGENTSVTFPKDYNYFALYLDVTKAIYMNSITINYRDPKDVNMDEAPVLPEDFASKIDTEDDSLMVELPSHEDWNPWYQINDGEALEADSDGIYHEGEFAPATLHTLKVWFKHYYHGDETEAQEFYHLTKPEYTIERNLPSEEFPKSSISKIEFGHMGEGVEIHFTITSNAETEEAENRTDMPARVKPRAVSQGNVLTIDSADDLNKEHVLTTANPIVILNPIADKETGMALSVNAWAVHPETNTSSAVKSDPNLFIDFPTGVAEIEAANDAEAVYFNLEGVKVANPENGTYIRVANGKANKVIVK